MNILDGDDNNLKSSGDDNNGHKTSACIGDQSEKFVVKI
jgi:hypothetical protein